MNKARRMQLTVSVISDHRLVQDWLVIDTVDKVS